MDDSTISNLGILILVLTKFPPSSVPVEYSIIADEFDIDVLD